MAKWVFLLSDFDSTSGINSRLESGLTYQTNEWNVERLTCRHFIENSMCDECTYRPNRPTLSFLTKNAMAFACESLESFTYWERSGCELHSAYMYICFGSRFVEIQWEKRAFHVVLIDVRHMFSPLVNCFYFSYFLRVFNVGRSSLDGKCVTHLFNESNGSSTAHAEFICSVPSRLCRQYSLTILCYIQMSIKTRASGGTHRLDWRRTNADSLFEKRVYFALFEHIFYGK